MRLYLVLFLLVVLFSLPFVFLGDVLEAPLEGGGALDWMRDLGPLGGAAGVALLVLDLFLPVPASAVLFGLGVLYGPLVGALLGFLGTMGAGLLGYGLARRWGRRGGLRVLGRAELRRAESLTTRYGGALVACSRWIPILPEVVSVAVGLAGLPPRRFLAALTVGNASLALVFAALGAWFESRPGAALFAAVVLSAGGWFAASRWLKRRESSRPGAPEGAGA